MYEVGGVALPSGVMNSNSAAKLGGIKTCPYCMTSIAAAATRCPACSGEMYYCRADQQWVGVSSKSINVGLLRGGRQMQHRCLKCRRVVAGPRF